MDLARVLWIVVVAALIAIEWWRRWRLVRVLLICMALWEFGSSQPNLYRAFRNAYTLPPAQRVMTLDGDSVRVDDYRSGVLTMYRNARWEVEWGRHDRRHDRMIALGVLLWLAVSPIIPRRTPARPESDGAGTDPAAA